SVQWSVQLVWSQPGTTWHDLTQTQARRVAASPRVWHTWARPGTAWHNLARSPPRLRVLQGLPILRANSGEKRGARACNAVCNGLGHNVARPGTGRLGAVVR